MRGVTRLCFQDPNLLEYQHTMMQRRHRCHLETIFGVHEVPSDPQIRALLDGMPVELMRLLLPAFCETMRRAGWAKAFTTPVSSGEDQRVDYPPDAGWKRFVSFHPS